MKRIAIFLAVLDLVVIGTILGMAIAARGG